MYVFEQEDIVLCKIYRKATSLKVLEERASIEELARASQLTSSLSLPEEDALSCYDQQMNFGHCIYLQDTVAQEVEHQKWHY